METKIYVVTNQKTDEKRLVQTKTPHQALAFVAKNALTAVLADQKTLVELVGKGIKVEDPDAPAILKAVESKTA